MIDCKERKIDELMKYEGLYELISEHFNIIEKIGSGTFSSVYLASLKSDTKRFVALKHVLPTSHPSRTENELQCLKTIGGEKNVVKLLTALRHFDNVIIAMDYMPHHHFQDYISDMELNEIQLYIQNLLLALEHVHSFHFIHRDIKPSNFLYDRKHKKFCLVDFGLAQKVDPIINGNTVDNISNKMMQDLNTSKSHQTVGKENIDDDKKKYSSSHRKNLKSCNCYGQPSVCRICLCRPPQIASRAGTAGFRAPEVLLKIPNQSTVIDMWSVGVIYMSLLSGTHPIFKPSDDFGSLCQIISLFGSEEVINMAKKYGKLLTCSAHYDAQPLHKISRFLRKNRKNNKKLNTDSDQFVNLLIQDDEKLIVKEQTKLNYESTRYDSPLLKDNNLMTVESHKNYRKVADNDVIDDDMINYHANEEFKIDNDYLYHCNEIEARLKSNLSNYSDYTNDSIIKDNHNKDNFNENDQVASLTKAASNNQFLTNNFLIDKIINNKNAYDEVIINDHSTSEVKSNKCIDDDILKYSCPMNDTIIAGNLKHSCRNEDRNAINFVNKPFVSNNKDSIRNNLNEDSLTTDYSGNINEKALDLAFDLLQRLLDIDPMNRWTATQSLQHPFFKQNL